MRSCAAPSGIASVLLTLTLLVSAARADEVEPAPDPLAAAVSEKRGGMVAAGVGWGLEAAATGLIVGAAVTPGCTQNLGNSCGGRTPNNDVVFGLAIGGAVTFAVGVVVMAVGLSHWHKGRVAELRLRAQGPAH
jgi:hypothetical protein